MYVPKPFEQTDIGVMHAFIRAHPLGAVVTMGPDGLTANHLPLLLFTDGSPNGTLQGHVARANPVWREADGRTVLVIFQGANQFISPSWYPTKQETGKVVPTWNFVVVHAHGTMRVVDDASWVRAHVEALTREHESRRAAPWSVSDAPADYIDAAVKGLVGFEIPIARLSGKWKVSQNRDEKDRRGVIEGLSREGGPSAAEMANLIAKTLGTRALR